MKTRMISAGYWGVCGIFVSALLYAFFFGDSKYSMHDFLPFTVSGAFASFVLGFLFSCFFIPSSQTGFKNHIRIILGGLMLGAFTWPTAGFLTGLLHFPELLRRWNFPEFFRILLGFSRAMTLFALKVFSTPVGWVYLGVVLALGYGLRIILAQNAGRL